MMRALAACGAAILSVAPLGARADDCALPGEPPALLTALLSPDCFQAAMPRPMDPRTAMDFGFPSLLFTLLPEAEAVEIVSLARQEGDRGFLAADPGMLQRLDSLPPPVADFVAASLAPEQALSAGRAGTDVLMALPLWGRPENARLLAGHCAAHDCQPAPSRCPDRVGLSDKLAVATGEMTLQQAQGLCAPSFEWLRALRQAGLVDTSCTSTMQINRIMADPALLDAPCYPADLSLADLPAASPADAARLLRQHLRQGPPATPLPEGSLDYIQRYWPEMGAYLRAMQQGGTD